MSVFNLDTINSPMQNFLGAVQPNIASGISGMFETHQQMQQGRSLAKLLGLDENQSEEFARAPPDIQKEFAKNTIKKKQEAHQDQETLQSQFNNIWDLMDKRGIGFAGSLNMTDEALGNEAQFKASQIGLISAARDRVNKGVLTNQKFQYIIDNLIPKYNERRATTKGKLKALAEEFGLKIPEKKPKTATGDNVWMLSPNKKRVQIPRDQVEAAIAGGGTLE